MPKKQLDETAILNDLRGASLFFQREDSPSLGVAQNPSTAPVDTLPAAQTIQTSSTPSPLAHPAQDPVQAVTDRLPSANEVRRSPLPSVEGEPQTASQPLKATNERLNEDSKERSIEQTMERLKPQSNKPRSERSKQQTKLRATFDIFADQLLALRELSIARERLLGGRVLLGDLAQEALELLIHSERDLTSADEATNEGRKERTKVRHSFDVCPDQLLALREIALQHERASGARVLLSDLARQALDLLIAKERNHEATNV